MNALLSALQDSVSKVRAAGTGGASGGVAATLVLWLVQVYVYHGDAVPAPIAGVIIAVLPALGAFIGGYLKRLSAADLARIAAAHPEAPPLAPFPSTDPIVSPAPVNPAKGS